ncbi:MAG: sensor domain-containing phosphodiesterase [Geminicoccaceae bacterium]
MTTVCAPSPHNLLAAFPFGACLLVREGEFEFWRVGEMNDRFASIGGARQDNWQGMPATGLLRQVLDEDRLIQAIDCLDRNQPFDLGLRAGLSNRSGHAMALHGRPNPTSDSCYLIMLRSSNSRMLERMTRKLATLRSDPGKISDGTLMLVGPGGSILMVDGGPSRSGLIRGSEANAEKKFLEDVLEPSLVGPAYRTLGEARTRRGLAYTSGPSTGPEDGRITITSIFLGEHTWLMLVAPPRQLSSSFEPRPLVAGLVDMLARRLKTTAVFFDSDLRINHIFEQRHLATASGLAPHAIRSMRDLIVTERDPQPARPGGLPPALPASWDQSRRWSLLALQPLRDLFLGFLEPDAGERMDGTGTDEILSILETTDVAIMSLDHNLHIHLATTAASGLWHLSPSELEGQPISAWLDPGDDAIGFDPTMATFRLDDQEMRFNAHCRRADGSRLAVGVRLLRSPSLAIGAFVLLFNEQHDRDSDRDHFHQLAYHDPVTRLPNRLLFADSLATLIERAERDGRSLAVMIIDIDRFHMFNQSLGMISGDRLLEVFADRLAGQAAGRGHVARLSADHFLLAIEDLTGSMDLERDARTLLARIEEPLRLDDQQLTISARAGLAIHPEAGRDAETLVRHADIALSHARPQGHGRLVRFTDEMTSRAILRLTLETQLRKALEHRQLTVYYQPQISVSDGSLIGFEALMRWQHPELGMVSPADFIPVAEETGLIIEIGQWALTRAMRQVRRWHEAGHDGLRLGINLSARQFEQEDLPQKIREAIEDTGFPASMLELELTESMVMKDSSDVVERLSLLTTSGASLAVDDFGTGYSSLAYLKRFPIRSLKIDRSFIADIDHDSNSAAIVQAIIAMGRTLDLKIVGEGIESEGQLRVLRDFGCDEVQGFFFAKPMPPQDVAEFLARSSDGRRPSSRRRNGRSARPVTPPDRPG